MARPPVEVADVIHAAAEAFFGNRPRWFTWLHLKVLTAILLCRTSALGGHIDECSRCGRRAISFNSCLMRSNSLWGVERGNRRKSNHSKPLFLPIKNLGLPKAGSSRGSDLS